MKRQAQVIEVADSDDELDGLVRSGNKSKRARKNQSGAQNDPVEVWEGKGARAARKWDGVEIVENASSSSAQTTRQAPATQRGPQRVLNRKRGRESASNALGGSFYDSFERMGGFFPGMAAVGYAPGEEMEEESLRKAIALSKATQNEQIRRQKDQEIRKQQDEELRLSMAMDRSKKEEAKRRKKAQDDIKLQELEKEMNEKAQQARKEEFFVNKRAMLERILAPETSRNNPDAVLIRLELPGKKLLRCFSGRETVQDLFNWAMICDDRCLRSVNFELVLAKNERIWSNCEPHQLAFPLGRLNLHMSCVRIGVINDEEDS